MRRSVSFERRLLMALVAFSLIPTLLLVGVGTALLREAASLQATQASWERLGDTGRALIDQTQRAGDAELLRAAERHREELSTSIQQAQRWGYLNRRLLSVIPWVALGFIATLAFLAIRSARRIARQLSAPIEELVGWSVILGRGDRLPAAESTGDAPLSEFGVLRESFRTMADELERSRAREIEAERVRASVGIARGVAHELKNALTPLRLAVHSLRRNGSRGVVDSEAITVIDEESDRLEALARAFAQLGQPPEGPASELDLVEMLRYLARTHIPGRIHAVVATDAEQVIVRGHYEALSRAFANLLQNAVEAIGEEEGTLRIEIGSADAESVEVRVVDSGPGIPPDLATRIWEADFTTKSRGTGLGLALVKQTVQAHGGHLEVGSAPGRGATMRVILPR